ncbi:MAG: alpha/beta hydrolase [Geodermatophilaceae bacterium]|nr:alpha/beta hydrolase [Geodermatophilaceae bacterium]
MRSAPVESGVALSSRPLPVLPDPLGPWSGGLRRVRAAGPGGMAHEVFVRTTPVDDRGTAEPALYVHGLGGASTNWTDLAGLLAGHVAGEAVDLPGFGQSPPPPRRDFSIANHARVVVALLEARGEPVHLLGNSLGGLVTATVAATRPDLVRTLTLVSPALPGGREPARSNPAFAFLLVPGLSRLAQRHLRRMTPRTRAEQIVALCFGDPSRVPEYRMAEAIEEVTRRADLPWSGDALVHSMRGLAARYVAVGPSAPWRLLRAISAPTLIVWGDRDRLVDVRLAARAAATIPDSRLLVLPGVGHTAQLEDPPAVARAVLGLITSEE